MRKNDPRAILCAKSRRKRTDCAERSYSIIIGSGESENEITGHHRKRARGRLPIPGVD